MTRLYVVAEGLAEVNFVTQLLKPHLEERSVGRVEVSAPNLRGHHTYAGLKKDVRRLLGSPSSAVIVTTMIDLFKVAGDFPGLSDCLSDMRPTDRVQYLEQCCLTDIGDHRFSPYLQLHEFEALVLSDLSVLAELYPSRRKAILELAKRLDQKFESPEHVNRFDPPSHRINCRAPGCLIKFRLGCRLQNWSYCWPLGAFACTRPKAIRVSSLR